MLDYLNNLLRNSMGPIKVSMSLVSDDTTSPYNLITVDSTGAVFEAQDGHIVAAPWSSIYVVIPA